MSRSSIELCSDALIKIGAEPIASFEDGTAESTVCRSLYPLVRDALLSAHPWSFTLAQAPLSRLADPPTADYAYAYQLPQGFLRALSAGSGGRGRGLVYRISGRRLHADSPTITLSYQFRPSEGDFPPCFAQALVAKLAAEFCIPLTENTSRAETLYRLANHDLRQAKQLDSQQDTPTVFEDFTLIQARMS